MSSGNRYNKAPLQQWGLGQSGSWGVKPPTPAPAPQTTQFAAIPNQTAVSNFKAPVSTPRPPAGQAATAAAPAPVNYQAPIQSSPVKGMITPPRTKTSTEPTGLFGSSVQGLVDNSKASKQQKKYLDDLRKSTEDAKRIAAEAQGISTRYGDEINRVGQLGAGAVAGYLSTGTNVVGSGNAAIASQSASARVQSLTNALNAVLQGNQQQLTGNERAITGQNYGLAGANTQQQLAQQGLSSAATYAQPSPAGYGQTVFDPLTGGYSGGSDGLNPQAVASQLAQQVKNGQMTYEQAIASLGYAGGAGQQFLNNALGGGFNPTLSSATMAGQANVLGQMPALESADIAAEGVKNKVITYLEQNPGLNPSAIAKANVLKQWVEGKQLSDPKYQTLFNYLNEYTNTLAPILGVGGDATNLKTEIAQSFVNAAASGQSIAEVLENMQGLSRGKLRDIRSGATGGGVVSSPFTTGGSGGGGNIFSW